MNSIINLKNKKGIILGIANEKSIAWGIAEKLSECGAELAIFIRKRFYIKKD